MTTIVLLLISCVLAARYENFSSARHLEALKNRVEVRQDLSNLHRHDMEALQPLRAAPGELSAEQRRQGIPMEPDTSAPPPPPVPPLLGPSAAATPNHLAGREDVADRDADRRNGHDSHSTLYGAEQGRSR